MNEGRGCGGGGCDGKTPETGGCRCSGCLLAIPGLSDFHACYPEIVLEIGFAEWMANRVREGGDCMVRIGGLGDSTLIACSLAVNHGEGYVAAWSSCYCSTRRRR